MVIHNPILTGSFTVNNIDVSSITSSAANITALNATTASLNSFSASVLSYTASQNILNGTYTLTSSFAAQTASFTAFTSSINAFSASVLAQTASLNSFSASVLAQTASLNSFSSSVLTFTGSASTRLGALEAATASLYTATSSLNASVASLNSYTQSNDAKIASIYSTTSSLNTRVGILEAYTSSLNNKTSSFATTGSNAFIGTQTITGSVLQSGSFTSTGTLTAQTLVVQTITSSVVYSSGSNIFGNALNNTQTFTGSVSITGSLTSTGATFTLDGNALTLSRATPSLGGLIVFKDQVGTSKARIGIENNANDFIIQDGSNNTRLTILNSTGAATFSSTITGTTIYGSTAVCSPLFISSGTICSTGNTCFGGMSIINNCLGIGTATPQFKLDIQGGSLGIYHNTSYGGGASGAQLYLGDMNFAGGGYACSAPGIGAVCSPVTGVAGDLAFYTYTGVVACRPERMRITSGGNVGIGITNPSYKLDVVGNGRFSTNIDVLGIIYGCSNKMLDQSSTYTRLYDAAGTLVMSLGSGNVGIGTCTPSAKLHINGSTGASTYKGFAYTYAGSETLTNEVLFQAVVGGYSSNLPIFLFKDERSDQGTTQRIFEIQGGRSGVGTILTTLANGNVGIGCTTPDYKLDISGSLRTTAGTYLGTSSSNVIIGGTTSDLTNQFKFITIGNTAFQYGASTGTYLRIEPGAADTEVALKADARSGGYPPMTFYTTATERMRITSTGIACFACQVCAPLIAVILAADEVMLETSILLTVNEPVNMGLCITIVVFYINIFIILLMQ